MSENKRYTKEYFNEYNNEYDFIEEDILTIFDNVSNKKYFMEFTDDDEMNNTIDELINRLNEQEEITQKYKHLVEIATKIIEWNTVPQICRAWQNYLNKVGDME